jgi:hypothetical protein
MERGSWSPDGVFSGTWDELQNMVDRFPEIPGITSLFSDTDETIPGNPFTGDDAADEAFKHLQDHHGIAPETASNRLHRMKEAAGMGADDDVAIGRTGDVYDTRTNEWIGSLTDPHWGQ